MSNPSHEDPRAFRRMALAKKSNGQWQHSAKHVAQVFFAGELEVLALRKDAKATSAKQDATRTSTTNHIPKPRPRHNGSPLEGGSPRGRRKV